MELLSFETNLELELLSELLSMELLSFETNLELELLSFETNLEFD